jgi:hypothetical protein
MYGHGLWTSVGWLVMIVVCWLSAALLSVAGFALAAAIWLAALILIPMRVRKSLAKAPDVPAESPVQMKKAAAA